MTPDKLKELREIAEKATPVVRWYPNLFSHEIRGPWNRWFQVVGPLTEETTSTGKIVRAKAEFDVEFAAEAMNSLVPLLDQLAEASEKLDKAKRALWHVNIETLQAPLLTDGTIVLVRECIKEISEEGAG